MADNKYRREIVDAMRKKVAKLLTSSDIEEIAHRWRNHTHLSSVDFLRREMLEHWDAELTVAVLRIIGNRLNY